MKEKKKKLTFIKFKTCSINTTTYKSSKHIQQLFAHYNMFTFYYRIHILIIRLLYEKNGSDLTEIHLHTQICTHPLFLHL